MLLDIEGLAASFSFFTISYVKRHANIPAHLCAKLACASEEMECWMSVPLSLLITSLLADSAGALSFE